MALETGSKAPDFTLKTKTADGIEEVTLSGNFGKQQTVLLFFPLAFSSVCTDEFCSISQDLDAYSGLNAQVYGISVDSPFALEAFARENNISVTLLSDFNKEAARAYDVLFEDLLGLQGVAKRSAFVIDTGGTITYSWSSDNPKDMPDFNSIKAALQ